MYPQAKLIQYPLPIKPRKVVKPKKDYKLIKEAVDRFFKQQPKGTTKENGWKR